MLRFRRPARPAGFQKHTADARRAVKRAIAAGETLDRIPALWREDKYKAAFTTAQHNKCGYCETFALNHPAGIDHHAPKAQVQVLVNEGFEAPGLYHVRGREMVRISDTGYHWLMFDWGNWLLVCERCNVGWKRALFPVREDEDSEFMGELKTIYHLGGIEAAKAACPEASCRPNRRRKFTPLLLGPFGPEDPVEHLEFTTLGQIVPRSGSEHGRQTIRTCGLHRESLRRARQRSAENAFRHSDRLMCALDDNDLDKARAAVEDLLSLGSEDSDHPGVVRSVVLSRLGYRWRDVENLAKKLATGPSR